MAQTTVFLGSRAVLSVPLVSSLLFRLLVPEVLSILFPSCACLLSAVYLALSHSFQGARRTYGPSVLLLSSCGISVCGFYTRTALCFLTYFLKQQHLRSALGFLTLRSGPLRLLLLCFFNFYFVWSCPGLAYWLLTELCWTVSKPEAGVLPQVQHLSGTFPAAGMLPGQWQGSWACRVLARGAGLGSSHRQGGWEETHGAPAGVLGRWALTALRWPQQEACDLETLPYSTETTAGLRAEPRAESCWIMFSECFICAQDYSFFLVGCFKYRPWDYCV